MPRVTPKLEAQEVGAESDGAAQALISAMPDAPPLPMMTQDVIFDGRLTLQQIGRLDYCGPQIVTNINASTETGKRLLLQAAGEPDKRLSDLDGQSFPLAFWLAEPTMITKEDDVEDFHGVRITLFSSDGLMVATTSWAVARMLTRLFQLFGPGPWDSPLHLVFHNVIRPDNKRSYLVELL